MLMFSLNSESCRPQTSHIGSSNIMDIFFLEFPFFFCIIIKHITTFRRRFIKHYFVFRYTRWTHTLEMSLWQPGWIKSWITFCPHVSGCIADEKKTWIPRSRSRATVFMLTLWMKSCGATLCRWEWKGFPQQLLLMTVFKIPSRLTAVESELQMSPERLSAGRNNNEWKNRKKNMTFVKKALTLI